MSLPTEQAKELRLSKLWEGVKSEIDDMIEAARNQMENEGKEKFDKWQSRIQTLKEIKALPENVIQRAKGA